MLKPDKKYIVVIPARGGSKRFPGKNVYMLNGKPLISYSIEYAKKYNGLLPVFVSTDSDEIAEVSQKYGAEIIRRPDILAGDLVSTAETLKHSALSILDKGMDFDYMILLQATNPLRPSEMLKEAIDLMDSEKYDSLMTVSPLEKKLGKIINERFVPWNYQYGQRSQDLEPLYYENGLLYISEKELILNGSIAGEKMFPMVIDHLFGTVDIDTYDDLQYAEYLMKLQNEQ